MARGFKSARVVMRRGVPVIALLALGLGVGPVVTDAVRHHSYFAVREVVTPSSGRFSAEALCAAAGIKPGMSVWDVNPADAEIRLRQLPWVRFAQVQRQPPNRVVIRVREQRPAAILVVEPGQALYYVSTKGRVFSTVEAGDPRDYPYVTGLKRAEGPTLRRALALVRLAPRAVPELGAISEVHVDQRRGLVLMPVRPAVPIEMGWGRFETKLAQLAKVLPMATTLDGAVTSVSLVFADEVVVRTRAARKGTT